MIFIGLTGILGCKKLWICLRRNNSDNVKINPDLNRQAPSEGESNNRPINNSLSMCGQSMSNVNDKDMHPHTPFRI